MDKRDRLTLAAVVIISALVYSLVCVKQYTWLFASGDSGDWLAAARFWMAPQPYGSPLYIVLGHALNALPGDLVLKMTYLLSVLPASVTVGLVYLIVRRFNHNRWIAVTSSVLLLGSAVFWSQATVLEEYSLAVMFLTLAMYWYTGGHNKLTGLALGLGTAVHVFLAPVAVLWLAVHAKEWRQWVGAVVVYLFSGVAPYFLILWLLAHGTPPLLAGGNLSWGAANSYLGSTDVVGTLAWNATGTRTLDTVGFLLVSFGLGLMPAAIAVKRHYRNRFVQMLVVAAGFSVWYALTSIDPTTWVFLIWGTPALVILAGLGLSELPAWHLKAVRAWALAILVVNLTFLNPAVLDRENPVATEFQSQIATVPDGSYLVMSRGGFEALGTFAAMSAGKDIVPVFLTAADYRQDALYQSYVEWANRLGVAGNDTLSMVGGLLAEGKAVYLLTGMPWPDRPSIEHWGGVFATVSTGYDVYRRITGITGEPDYNEAVLP
ncbi:MAG: DUF2723 domain-containing protein [Nitrososphaerota archaeon]|nr:DUF2723 domain-containing protein [Nitrososphaerota archaeon]